MNLQQIKYFIALANTKNFTRASEQVHVVQSTFSAGIKKLESHLEVKLFERDKRNVSLTSAGEILLPKAIELMNQWYTIEETFEIRTSLDIKLGFVQNIDINIVLPIVNELKKQYALSEVKIYEDKHAILLQKLDTNSIHAFFTEHREVDKTEYQTYNIASEKLFFAINQNHPLAKMDALELSALHNQPFIERSHCLLYNDVFDQLEKQSITPNKMFTAHNNETVGALITSGMGITLMPKPFFEMPQVKFIPIKGHDFSKKIMLLFKRSNKSVELKKLLELIKKKEIL